MTVRKRGGYWCFDFQIKGVRYREAISEARTKFTRVAVTIDLLEPAAGVEPATF